MRPPGPLREWPAWATPVLLAIGWLAFLAAYQGAIPEPAGFQAGVAYLVRSYDQWLPLLGLGVALAPIGLSVRVVTLAAFASATAVGLSVEPRIATIILARAFGPETYAALLGPLACAVAGASLALPRTVRVWLMVPVGLVLGGDLGLLLGLNDQGNPAFIPAVVAAGALFVVTALLVRGRLSGAWVTIASRIFASWLVAIGILLVGAELLARPRLAQTILLPPVPGDHLPAVGEPDNSGDITPPPADFNSARQP